MSLPCTDLCSMRGSHCARLLHGSLSSKTSCNLLGTVLQCHVLEQQQSQLCTSTTSSSSSSSRWTTPGADGTTSSSINNLHTGVLNKSISLRSFSSTSSNHGRPQSGSSHLAPIPHFQGAVAPATDSTSSQQLLRAIREAREVQQLQALLLRHADIWRAQHIAAAFRCFPELRPHLYNARQSQLSTLGLLLRGLVRVLDRLSAPDLVEALLCLARFRLAPPAEIDAICLRLVQLLEAGEQPLSARLRPQQWADAARALAGVQVALGDPQLQQNDWDPSRVVAQSQGSWAAGVGAAEAAADDNLGSPSTGDQASSSRGSSGTELTQAAASSTPSILTPTTSSSSEGVTGVSSDLVSSSSSSRDASSALAQRGAMEKLWLLVFKGSVTQLDNFDANDAAAWCWALVKRRRWPQEVVRATLRSVRLRPHKLLPQHTLQVLASSLEAGVGNVEQWEVLLRALQKQRHELALLVLTRALELMAARQQYLPDVAFDLTAAALRHLKGAPTQHLLQLAAALAELGHYQAPVIKALCKQVTPVVGSMPAEDLGQLLWALQHLGHQGKEMDALAAAVDDTLTDRPSLAHATPAAAIKLLWACGSLGLGPRKAHEQLVAAVAAEGDPQGLPDGTLCLLHQARLLLEAPGGAGVGQRPKQLLRPPSPPQQQQSAGGGAQRAPHLARTSRPAAGPQTGDAGTEGAVDEWMEGIVVHDVGDVGHHNHHPQQQQQQQDHVPSEEGLPWPAPLMEAAAAAAGVYAMRVAASERSRRQQIAALLEQCGLPPLPTHTTPVPGVVADVALLGEGGGVAVLASGLRYTRSQPVQLVGYWRNAEQLLRQQGWRVVHLPPHEWEALIGDGAAEDDDALVHVANKLLEAGVTW